MSSRFLPPLLLQRLIVPSVIFNRLLLVSSLFCIYVLHVTQIHAYTYNINLCTSGDAAGGMSCLAVGLGLNIGWMPDDDEDGIGHGRVGAAGMYGTDGAGSMSVLAGSGMPVLAGTDKPVLSGTGGSSGSCGV